MNYNQALEYIHSLLRFGSKPGLERITKLLNILGNPQDKLNFLHVAGTNGKGSTSVFLSSILQESGMKTGLYTSPFITKFNERIQINGVPISGNDLALYTSRVKSAVDSLESIDCPITEFEFITALAFLYFKEQNCDAVVLEVGLGGRLDATNVIKSPKASIITQIDLDHTEILGETIAEITREKCGIIKPGCPVITTSDNSVEAIETIKKIANSNNSKLFISNKTNVNVIKCDIFNSEFSYNDDTFLISLAGGHQISNAINAIKAIKVTYPDISVEKIKLGLSKAKLPARCEVISNNPLVILDGSHNPNGTLALSKLLKQSELLNLTAIVGFMADKDIGDALSNLNGVFKKIITVEVKSNKRSMTAEDLCEKCKDICDDVSVASDYQEAINLAKDCGTLIVFGSLYLAGDIRPILLQHFKTK